MNLQTKTYPLISVVVPAYNTETRIAYSLESIIAQDYPNIEIIVVNDASTDGTENAARRILENCGRPFTIITHKENRGVSASRNTGMDVVKGEFLWFVDSDYMGIQMIPYIISNVVVMTGLCFIMNFFMEKLLNILFLSVRLFLLTSSKKQAVLKKRNGLMTEFI